MRNLCASRPEAPTWQQPFTMNSGPHGTSSAWLHSPSNGLCATGARGRSTRQLFRRRVVAWRRLTFFVGPEGFNTRLQNGGKFGLRADFNIRDHWAVEGRYLSEANGLDVAHTTPVQSRTDLAPALLLQCERGRFRRFVAAGIGHSAIQPHKRPATRRSKAAFWISRR